MSAALGRIIVNAQNLSRTVGTNAQNSKICLFTNAINPAGRDKRIIAINNRIIVVQGTIQPRSDLLSGCLKHTADLARTIMSSVNLSKNLACLFGGKPRFVQMKRYVTCFGLLVLQQARNDRVKITVTRTGYL